ncbi:MAG: 30S ribosomal protein S4 [archaeon]|nr:30S ribosomal protein S4 [archaeon]
MPIRKHKRYSRPKKLFDIALIKSEKGLIKKYGLKTRREVWKADFAIGKIRNIAKTLITAEDKKKEEFIKRQVAKGFAVNSIADVLALSKEDYLKRRLESIIVAKKLALTHKQARQLIAHKHVKLNGNKINCPGHLTTLEEEKTIEVDLEFVQKKVISDEERKILEKIRHEEKKEATN